jgi:hypothetical protein
MGFEWVCQSCSAPNAAGAGRCSACGFSAQFTVRQLHSANAALKHGYDVSPVPTLAAIALFGAFVPIYLIMPDWALLWIGPRTLLLIGLFLMLAVFGLIKLFKTVLGFIRRIL